MDPIDAGGNVLYRAVRAVSGAAVAAYFGRLEVTHAERLPREGPVLLVANHPSSLTDVLILGVALPRRMHFLAHHGLFRPWIRGLVLRLCGTLPVYRREDAPTETWRNDATFAACHALFRRGGVVVIFPEGTSQTDRQIQRLKTGAARLALRDDAVAPGALTVVPVGLHFVERTTFRSEVVVSVGRTIDLAPFRAAFANDAEEAVRVLTTHLQTVLEKLIVHVPGSELAALVHLLEAIYLDELRADYPGAPDLALAQGLADCVEYFARTDPERLYHVWRRALAYRHRLAALNLRDPAVREHESVEATVVRSSVRLLTWGAVLAVPAAVGALAHVVPYQLTEWIARLTARDATRISFARIVVGVILFPLAYAGYAVVLARLHWPPRAIVLTLVALVPLGFIGLAYMRWMKRERHRVRLALLAVTNKRLVARVRRDRREVIRLLDAARADYLAATRGVAS